VTGNNQDKTKNGRQMSKEAERLASGQARR